VERHRETAQWKGVVERLSSVKNEDFRKMMYSKTVAIENEVDMLMEEVRSLRELLGAEEPVIDVVQEQRKKPRKKQPST
jgi:TATA-binding protein-associated factor Taf7